VKNAILGFGMFVLLSVSGIAHATTEWNAQDYDLYAGDFDGDGKTDLLYIAKDPSMPSGIARSDGTGPNIAWQSWASNFLGINWSGNTYNVIVADFNGDGKADIFLQSVGPGNSYLLLTSNTGLVVGISQTIANGAMGLTWSADQHHIVAGDFNGDHQADLFLQATSPSGTNAVIFSGAGGLFSSATPAQTWSDGYLGFKWSTLNANVFAGDFNGDGRADLLIQAKPNFVMINYDVPFPVPTYPPNMNGVVLSQTGTTPFTAVGAQAWSRMNNGVDWSPLTNNVVVANDGSGKSEVILQARNSTGTSYELTGNATGAIFPSSSTALSSNVSLSASSTHLIAANFAGGKGQGQFGLFFQALTSAGTNYTTTAVGATITATTENPTTVTGTVEPTSAGRTAGQFSVTPSGAASYNIPIWTPPGAREIEPHLALHYTSGGPDGVMGPGWGLTGVSAIVRCGKTWASAGGTATNVGSPVGVTLSTNDDLCLDGNRLRLISGVQGMGGSTYMAEIADFSLITANGSSNSPATSFTVQGKDGKYYEYGNTADSKITATGFSAPYMWGIDKVSDRQNNSMAYAYISGATTLSLSTIQYTATPGSAASGFKYQVSFSYTPRSGSTKITRYVAGGAVTQSQQLSNIQVFSLLPSSTLVRKYNLGYSASPTTSRPLLNSIQECGGTSGTDCLRPTRISYQPGLQGWNTSAVSTGVTATNGYVPVDLNGDGIPDALYSKLSGSTLLWYARIASRDSLGNISFGTEISTGITTGINDAVIPGRFTGVPGTQLLVPASGSWRVYTLALSGNSFSFASTGIPVNGEQYAIDYDGDGLSDLVNVGIGSVTIRRNMSGTLSGPYNATPAAISNPYNAGPAFASPTTVYVVDSQNQGQIQNWTTSPWMAKSADFNGDGRGDLMLQESDLDTNTNGRVTNTIIVLSNGFGNGTTSLGTAIATTTRTGMTTNAVFVDWNGDGCTDIVSSHILFLSQCNGYFTNGNFTQPSATFSIPYPASGNPAPQVVFADWDGDGLPDLIYTDPSKSGNNVYVQRSTGAGVAPPVLLPLSVPSTKTLYAVDQDADGQTDLAVVDSNGNFALSYYPHLGVGSPPDLATAFIDGFGIAFSPSYVTLETSIYTPGSGAQYPEMDFRGAMYVVNQFSASDGTGGTYQNTFTYSAIRLNLLGRGFEGFATTTSTDSRNGLIHSVAYSQAFPSIGAVLEDDTFQSGGTTPISKTSNSYYVAQLVGSSSGYSMPGSAGPAAACPVSCFSYVQSAMINRYELGTYKNGQLVSNAVTNYTYDAYGTLTVTNSTLTDQDSGLPASPFNGQSWLTTISNSITNYPSTWCLGRPNSTTSQKTAPGQPTLTRTVNHTIDSTNCRATNETVEPGTPLQVATTFQFDPSGCGNTTSVSVVGLDETGTAMPARTTLTDYNYYSGRCQSPELVTNPYTQKTYAQYRYDLGLKQTATDANGVSVNWVYDNFGRKTSESRPDLTSTTWSYVDCVSLSCWGTADLRFQTTETLLNSSGGTVRLHETFSDGLDRVRYDEGNRVLGVWTTQVTTYDPLGRKHEVDLPYSSSTNGFHIYTYDAGNRPLTDTLYTSSGSQYRQIQMAYQGQTAIVTDPNGHAITKVTDVAGKLRWVTDPPEGVHGAAAGTTKYTYDSFDNLVTIVDAIGATSSYTYNIRGFKIGSNDADTGSWTFQPDSLNELKVQKDANLAVTKFTYDLLGRMVTRLEPESTTPTSWTYGTNAAFHEIGQLNSVSKPDGYAENYTYDGIGRPLTKKYTEDGTTYQFDYAYNTLGAPDTLTYPTSTPGVRFQLKYLYDSTGYLNEVKDASAGTPFWTLTSANDNGAPTMEVLGNGVSVVTGYTPWTNEMVTRTEGSGNSTTNLQNLTYSWDLNGNLLQREDNRQSLTEKFTLDALNRLSTVTLINPANPSGTQTLSVQYDQAGDITNKSDVGAYTYGNTAHPHAVTAAGTWTIGYDANGNMNSRAGGAISSYSYNLPNQINYNGSSSQFNYDSSHQRWKQVANYAGTTETVHYIGGLLQVVTRGTNPTEYRHQIPAGSGTAVYTRRSDGTAGTYYATSDHLGSADLVMDSNANVLVRESFSPFGARRGSNWQSIPTPQDYSAIQSSTRQGFTGHEMLDSVGLIHMNGRVYDPTLGRFLSADSVIQSLGATQSVNPYSYAWNDPLRYTDPSGHSLLGAIVGLVAAIIAIYLMQPAYFAAIGGTLNASTAVVAGFVGGFVSAAISTGNFEAAYTAGIIGAVTAGLFYAAGFVGSTSGSPWEITENVLAHAAVGCLSAAASSGNCGKGAVSAAIADAATPHIIKFPSLGQWSGAPEAAEAGLIGGVVARIEGGKFTDGFSVGAAGYLFNQLAHNGSDPNTRGARAVEFAAKQLKGMHYTILGFYVSATDPLEPGYTRVYDLAVITPDGEYGGVEVKSSIMGVFRINPLQQQFDVDAVQHNAILMLPQGPVTMGAVEYYGVGCGGMASATWSSTALYMGLLDRGIMPKVSIGIPLPSNNNNGR
jgi:RHS repeat-associated protein